MTSHAQTQRSRRFRSAAVSLMALVMAVGSGKQAYALIVGRTGNAPIHDPGWPQGAAKIFNRRERVAWWEGRPLGGGEWHAECRGNAQAINGVLDDFAKLDVKNKRVRVHDGAGASVWLNANGEAAKRAAAEIDWNFTVWQRGNWERVRKFPPELRPPDLVDGDKGPPAEIDLYVGGRIHWSDVVLPHGLEVVDERLGAHGFSAADGIVLEGNVFDLATKQPIAARLQLERLDSQPKSDRPGKVAGTVADLKGHWVLKNVPTGWYRLVADKEGYVSCVVAYARLSGQPQWHGYDGGLARAASLSGRVTDEAGRPVSDVTVRLANVVPQGSAGGYRVRNEVLCKTDKEGRLQSDHAPAGSARIELRKAGYVLPGLGPQVSLPAKNVLFKMERSAQVRVVVAFRGNQRSSGYLVEIEAEGGPAVGKWGGSASIDQQDQVVFANIPPGRYVIQGHPNPFSTSRDKRATPIIVELTGGQSAEVTLSAR
jgi:hypothetical protein